jgi:mono/diheme cytochrome c family protein
VRESDEATTDEEESAAVTKPGKQEEPLAFPYLATTEGREGYELAEEETNTYRVYDFYKRQAKHHLKQDRELKLLPAYPDLDGGTFGHWGNYNKNGHKDLRWNDMDYGPALAATYSIDKKKKIGGMLSVRLPGGHTVTFNKDTGGYYNAWEGRPYFNPHRWGLIHGVAVPEGVTAVDLSSWFAPISKDGASMSRYLGHYLHGRRVITHYEIGKTRFLDSVSRMGNGCYTRTITATQAGAVTIPFDLKDQWGIKTVGQSLIATKDGVVVAAKSFSKGTQVVPMREGGKWKSPANSDAIKLYFYAGSQVEAVIAAIKADRKLDPLQEWTGGGKSNWPERFKEQVSLARNDKAYVVDRIGVPFKNPWASMMMFSGIAFDKDGVAYLTTLMGDVWKVSGLGADTKEVTWKRFATGLNQPFGIRVIDGLPYVLTRGSIVCLKDLNADDEADYYEDNFNGFSYSPSAHTHTFGFPMDKDRAAYFVSGGGAYKKPWNQPVELLASGLRNAMAVGASREGVFLVGPQEGVWTPSSAVLEIQKGDYYGMGPNKVSKGSGAPAEITPAMAYLPRGIDNSTGGFEFPESDRFGPLNGKIIGLSYGYGSWFQILRNDGYADYGRAQGAIVPLAGEFRSGVVRGAVHPGDGMFYVVGTDGWGNYALEDGSLERIRYTGKSFPMLENVHGYENGIELQFSSKLSGNAAASTENYFVQQWNYEYSPAYGSLEFSVRQPAQEGHDRLKVTRAKILPDGKSVFLEIPDLLPALQTHIYADLKTADGPLEVNTFATLVHLDKAKPGFAEPLPELKSRTASLRVRSMKTANERVAGNTANTLEGRIRAGENMFKLFCTGCHGPQGQGLPNIGPTLNSDWVAGDPAALVKALLHGLTGEIKVNGKLQHFEAGMPAFGEALGDYEIAAILSFVRSRWSDDKAGVPIEFVRKVRADEKGKTGPYQAKDLWKTANAKPKTSVGESWVVDSQADWTAARGAAENVKLADGFAEPKADKASFQSVVRTFPTKRKLSSVVFEQSPVWDNWEQIDDITPQGAGNAYVFLPVAPGNYYFFATRTWPKMEYPEGLARNKRAAFRQEWNKKHPRGYHAWHSTDLKDWKHLGLVCPSSCMTTAEYADGKFYLYYDNPNDENPHLIIDDDLTDGVLGKDYGEVFSDPSHGSDAGIFRDEDGTFHMIYEDWSPINARENGWDSPLAGRVSSLDGIKGFKYGEHPPAVDHRTKPTGKIGTFTHPAMKISNDGKPLEYEIHEPRQNAYGDWTLIKVGSHYHLFGDYDSADHNKPMRMARFHTDDLNKEFKWSGEIGKGFHPDPSVGFAEGKFYVIIQRATDFVSPGPWVDGVEARAGVDKDGDGTIDEWTDWQAVKESYSQKSGFARIVDVAPARVGTDKLPAGQGFAFEYRTSRLDNGVQPIMDRVTLEFDKD